jgi:hypothetical protein
MACEDRPLKVAPETPACPQGRVSDASGTARRESRNTYFSQLHTVKEAATGRDREEQPPEAGHSACGQLSASRMTPASDGHRRSGSRSGPEVRTNETTELVLSVGPCFHHVDGL